MPSAQEREEYQYQSTSYSYLADVARSKKVYNAAFMSTLNDTTFNQFLGFFEGAKSEMRKKARSAWVDLQSDQLSQLHQEWQ